MKTTKIITETKEQEVIDDVYCNKCGESCKLIISDNIVDFYGLIETTVSGGFYSYQFGLEDRTNYTFSLCEKCLKNLFDSFKLPVEVTEYL